VKREIRILFIEDIPADVVLVNHALRKGGLNFSTRHVYSKEIYLRELAEHPPDLILSDHGLPSFDGFTALAIAREKCPDVPFIFVTNSQGEEMAIKIFESGAADYVLKTNLAKLVPAVHRALRAAEERVKAKQKDHALAEAANQELDAFTYSVSHDLRAPLRHIIGYVDIMQSTAADQLDDNSRQYLAAIARSAAQMSQLIDTLLEFSRLGRSPLHIQWVNLAQLVKEARAELSRETEGRDIEWHLGELPDVRGDPLLLRQAIFHLIGNALKFTRMRTRAQIEIGARSTKVELIFFVRDNGVGFDAAYVDKLFGVFQRLHRADEFEGLGIGLAKVRRIIHRHGGRTWAEGALNAGATFYFAIPKSPKDAP
jgi:signal transduction histidine kinase